MSSSVEVDPGYPVPGLNTPGQLIASEFEADGTLACPIPGCFLKFNEKHGERYTIEKWKAHVVNWEKHQYLWYDSALSFQPPALANTYIRVDKHYNIAVCHYRREPVNPKKLDDHCKRCRGCLYVDHSKMDELTKLELQHVSERDLLHDRKAVQGFDACEAYYCCQKLYGPSQQGIHSHLKSPGQHAPSAPVKCMRYRTSRHGYAYIPVNEQEYNQLNRVTDTTVVAGLPPQTDPPKQKRRASSRKQSPTISHYTVPSLRNAVLAHGYQFFQQYYAAMTLSCVDMLDNLTWNLHKRLNGLIMSHTSPLSMTTPGRKPIVDFGSNTAPGYSFLVDPQNGFNTRNGGPLWHLVAAQLNDAPVPQCIKNACSNCLTAHDIPSLERYLQQCHESMRKLAVLVYTACPIPPESVNDLLATQFTNSSTHQRSLFVTSGRECCFRFSNLHSIAMPAAISEILIRHLTIVRPMQLQLAHLCGYDPIYIAKLEHSLFVGDFVGDFDAKWFANEMAHYTRMFLPTATSVEPEPWRAILQEMCRNATMKPNHQHVFTPDLFSKAWFNSTGLRKLDEVEARLGK